MPAGRATRRSGADPPRTVPAAADPRRPAPRGRLPPCPGRGDRPAVWLRARRSVARRPAIARRPAARQHHRHPPTGWRRGEPRHGHGRGRGLPRRRSTPPGRSSARCRRPPRLPPFPPSARVPPRPPVTRSWPRQQCSIAKRSTGWPGRRHGPPPWPRCLHSTAGRRFRRRRRQPREEPASLPPRDRRSRRSTSPAAPGASPTWRPCSRRPHRLRRGHRPARSWQVGRRPTPRPGHGSWPPGRDRGRRRRHGMTRARGRGRCRRRPATSPGRPPWWRPYSCTRRAATAWPWRSREVKAS